MISATISHYRIIKKLGAGGMGEVYLAEDTRLRRKVALKILSAELTKNPDKLRRFEQEAFAASALSHPNILVIHEIGTEADRHFIATEFIEGETLRDRIVRKKMDLEDALDVAIQASSALAAAHKSGIVHRDIKPENIMLREDGYIKVLDFGLAKLVEPQAPSADTEAQTVARIDTDPGTLMGTVNYMSPEQAKGKVVDSRTDVFSLGVVVFEMVAGRPPFGGDSSSEVLAAILDRDPPPLARFEPDAPLELQRIVSKALRKDREQRYQTIKDLLIDLRSLRDELNFEAKLERSISPESAARKGITVTPSGATLATARESSIRSDAVTARTTSSAEYIISEIKRHKTGVTSAAVVCIITIAAVAFGLYRFFGQNQPKSPGTSLKIIPFTSFPGEKSEPAFSPDGNQIAFVWDGGSGNNLDIYVKLIDGGNVVRLTNNPAPDRSPCWSPDGRRIAFTRSSKDEGGLYIVPQLGGPEQKLASFKNPLETAWSPDGKRLAVTDEPSSQELRSIFLVSLENGEKYGEKRKLASPSAQFDSDRAPRFSPDGQMLAFIRSPNFLIDDIYLVPNTGGEPKRLTFDNMQVAGLAWTSDGREIVFSSNRGGPYGLWRVSVSGGAPEPLPAVGESATDPFVSRQGNRLAYTYRKVDRNIWRAPGPHSTAKSSVPTKFIASSRNESSPQYSPDGRKIAFASNRAGSLEIWVCDSEGQNPVQLTNFGGTHTGTPRWSPDGQYIAFDSRPEGSSDIYVISADGGKPRRLTTEASADIMPVWSRDGRWIYFGSDRSGDFQIWKIPSEGGESVQVTKQGGYGAVVSPDDNYVYYGKRNEPGIWRVGVDGGEEVRIFDKGYAGETVVLDEGICFLDPEATPNPTVNFFSFATRQVTQLATIEKAKYNPGPPTLTVSTDGKWVLYLQVDQVDNDIMLVENFR